MDATTARRIGNAALVLALFILAWAICGKLGWVPPMANVRVMSMFGFVLAMIARGFRRRADRAAAAAGD
ncbi:MAG TPA: hypothetical protein VNC18_12625 [Gemmatimonadaceae bacterium]|jgi:hypothetical protein|nr:hypothetical protein [Gemmatimonadaceae bacterium]